jgi:hypothetical protein
MFPRNFINFLKLWHKFGPNDVFSNQHLSKMTFVQNNICLTAMFVLPQQKSKLYIKQKMCLTNSRGQHKSNLSISVSFQPCIQSQFWLQSWTIEFEQNMMKEEIEERGGGIWEWGSAGKAPC